MFAFLCALPLCAGLFPAQGKLSLDAPVFDRLVAVHPYSIPNAMAVGPGGRYVYVGEGGSLAIIDASLSDGFENAKRVPISSRGVKPANLIVDSGALAGSIADDFLLIAAGRSGLWIQEADPAGENRAARVDDSGSGDPAEQNSRRWCVDVGVFSIREDATTTVHYVAALFAAKNDTHLRVYRRDDVRAVLTAHPGFETGHELAPVMDFAFDGHPLAFQPTAPFHVSNLLGLSLDVDQDTPDRVAIYMALGAHGLARVGFLSNEDDGLVTTGVEWGPVFGTGTPYHGQAQNGENYSNFQYRSAPGDPIQREEPPLVVDVAVQNFGGGHWLYVALDTLGWMRFALDESLVSWGPTMPINHHEGEPIPNHPFGEIQFRLQDHEGTTSRTRA